MTHENLGGIGLAFVFACVVSKNLMIKGICQYTQEVVGSIPQLFSVSVLVVQESIYVVLSSVVKLLVEFCSFSVMQCIMCKQ